MAMQESRNGEPTREAVFAALKECYDPEIPVVNIVDLGLVYNVELSGEANSDVKVTMTLTSIGCPMADQIQMQVTSRLLAVQGVKNAVVEVVFDPPWSPEKMTEEAKVLLNYRA
ncbi:MAG TPA: metal-sulfur cluster assembly factor [archaeon]|nr:metal-sulfur cluster assembly factor [archaeon]